MQRRQRSTNKGIDREIYDNSETTAPCFDPQNNFQEYDEFQNPNLNHSMLPNCTTPNAWGPLTHHIHEMGLTHFDDTLTLQPNPTDLLTLLQLPRFSLSFLGEVNPAMMVDIPSGSASPTISYDPTDPGLHPNLTHQLSPMFDGYGNGQGNSSSLFGGFDNTIKGFYQHGDESNNHRILGNNNGVFEFGITNNEGNVSYKCPKNSFTDKQRRRNFNDKYNDLRRLIPNQTKDDRASIVQDAIDHIHELKRTVGELKVLVAKKRMIDEEGVRTVVKPDPDQELNIQMRSSWIQRNSKDTKVDVRIVDDDVTIKLSQRKKNINCLLKVSKTLDELGLDLHHAVGGHVGDYYSYLFNSKICEGSSVYASAIANEVIQVLERQYDAAASVAVIVGPTTSF